MDERILILDFGSQYTQLIARRIRELNVYCEIHPFNNFPHPDRHVKGIILSGSPHSVLEVDRSGSIVWRLDQRDLPGIVLAWVTTLEVLPNGNYVLGNCHAGPGQPLLVEIEPVSKRVVWRLDGFERFGNSVSNSLLLEVAALR